MIFEAKRAKQETRDKQNPYSVKTVPKWDSGLLSDKVMKSLGMYPEPPLKADREQRPGGRQNPGLKQIRAAPHGYYSRMQASPKENGYLLWLLKIQSMTMDEMMNGKFGSASASIVLAWTEEGLIKVYDEQKRTLIQDVPAQLKKLNYLQWEAMIKVMGEKCFLVAGPIGAYGPSSLRTKSTFTKQRTCTSWRWGTSIISEESRYGSLDKLLWIC